MTRKRFIKLLMSHGETLYSARAIAFMYNVNNVPYKEAYSEYLLKTSFKRMARKVSLAFRGLGSNIQSVVQAFNRLAFSMKEMNVDNDN